MGVGQGTGCFPFKAPHRYLTSEKVLVTHRSSLHSWLRHLNTHRRTPRWGLLRLSKRWHGQAEEEEDLQNHGAVLWPPSTGRGHCPGAPPLRGPPRPAVLPRTKPGLSASLLPWQLPLLRSQAFSLTPAPLPARLDRLSWTPLGGRPDYPSAQRKMPSYRHQRRG